MTVYGYIRVSTERQTVENQRYEIEQFCLHQHLSVCHWIEETVSGTIAWEKRALGRLLKKAAPEDLLICTELSRLGRSLFMILNVLNHCMTRQIRVWTIKDNYRLGDDISSKVLAFAFGLSAEIERNLISQRTREALARRRAAGLPLGRTRGSPQSSKTTICQQRILALHQKGFSQSEIARKLHLHPSTISRFLRRQSP
ncbi:MAG: master DNA invertase Mpi family serine-type recombinase [Kiritimatiellae bacterium]|nr:master DNA invertase Mpi family serine-type recombinase [Kiritimatiellia bacterium]